MSDARQRVSRLWVDCHRALHQLRQTVTGAELEPSVLELVHLCASELNGSGARPDGRDRGALTSGASAPRLVADRAWKTTDVLSARERAAMALTEAVIGPADAAVPLSVFQAAATHFTADELGRLVYEITEIATRHRFAIEVGDPTACRHRTSPRAEPGVLPDPAAASVEQGTAHSLGAPMAPTGDAST